MATPIIRLYPSKVLATASEDNDDAVAKANAGASSQRYYITGVDAFYSATGTDGSLKIYDGATTGDPIWEGYVYDYLSINFNFPLECSLGTELNVVLEASGNSGTIGKVNVRGYLY